ncbi:MAG: hypothetical protein ACPG1A_17650, partial [Halioglobus sp.]
MLCTQTQQAATTHATDVPAGAPTTTGVEECKEDDDKASDWDQPQCKRRRTDTALPEPVPTVERSGDTDPALPEPVDAVEWVRENGKLPAECLTRLAGVCLHAVFVVLTLGDDGKLAVKERPGRPWESRGRYPALHLPVHGHRPPCLDGLPAKGDDATAKRVVQRLESETPLPAQQLYNTLVREKRLKPGMHFCGECVNRLPADTPAIVGSDPGQTAAATTHDGDQALLVYTDALLAAYKRPLAGLPVNAVLENILKAGTEKVDIKYAYW